MTFDMGMDFRIVVNHDGIESDLKLLSSSERMRLGVVLQDAIIRLSGLRFMVIDNCDLLDSENRALLMDTLIQIKDSYDTILMLSTIGPNGATNPHIDDVSVFMLADGKLEEVT